MTEKDKRTVLAFAECDMNTAKTARKLCYHRETIKYQLTQIGIRTGLDPRRFYDLVKLVIKARGE